MPERNMNNPFLVGENIYLRSLSEEDTHGNWLNWFNDREVCQYNGHFRFPTSKESLRTYLQKVKSLRNIFFLGIIRKDDDTHIGNISLQNIDWINRNGELAIIIGEKKLFGKGLGYEACRIVLKHGFDELNLMRIYCGTAERNIAMQKIALKLGMDEEGRQRQVIYKNGKYFDNVMYGITQDMYCDQHKK